MKNVIITAILLLLILSTVSAEKPTVTVLDFKTNNVSGNDMTSIISFLSGSLFTTDKFVVIDTAQRDTILAELEFSNSGCTDESCQLEIGMLLSAEYIVTGDIAIVGSRYVLSAKMVETETSATKNIAKGVYADLDELIDDMDGFAIRLSDSGEQSAAAAELPVFTGDDVDESAEVSSPDWGFDPVVKKVVSWSTLGAGVIAAGVFGYLALDADTFRTDTVLPAYEDYKDETVSDYGDMTGIEYYQSKWEIYEAAETEYIDKMNIAYIVGVGGAVLLGTSLFFFLAPETVPTAGEPELAFLFLPGVRQLSFAGRIRI